MTIKQQEELGNISTEVSDKIAKVTFYHPNHNALPSFLLAQLAAVIRRLGKSSSINVIILQSAGDKTFCAGANFDELLAIKSEEEGKAFFSGFAHVINAMRLAKQPIIGRIQGKAIGGAVGLAAACDYCFASKDAFIKLSELSIGIGPFVIGPAVQRKMGLNAFTELALHPTEFKSAAWAQEKGLFHSLSDNISQLDHDISTFCNELASYSVAALHEIKKSLWQDTAHWDSLLLSQAEISGRLIMAKKTKLILKKFKSGNKTRS